MASVALLEAAVDARAACHQPRTWVTRPWLLKVGTIAVDVVAIAMSMAIAFRLRNLLIDRDRSSIPARNTLVGLFSLPIWIGVFLRYHLYSARHIASRLQEFRHLVHATGFSVVGMAAASFILGHAVARGWLALLFPTALIVLTCERAIVRRVFTGLRRRGRLLRRVLVAGSNGEAQALASTLAQNRSLGYEVLGFIQTAPERDVEADPETAGYAKTILESLRAVNANGVIIAASGVDSTQTNSLVRELTTHGVHVELSSSLFDISADRLSVRPLGPFSVLYLEPVRRTGWRAVAKRAFDLITSGVGLIVLSPLMMLIALSIRLTSPGPAIFRQVRVGYQGRRFQMLKFRTMVQNACEWEEDLRSLNDVDGPLFKMRSDPRMTRLGRWLRSFSLDEVPQLWNVMRGDMSMVGPRPGLPSEAVYWDPKFSAQRLSTRPGITGMWQVSGRSRLSFEEYVRLDLYYVDNWSLWTDVAIVARTVPVVLMRRGAC